MTASGTFGPFELGEEIGEGAMGEVYRATHVADGTDAAVKVLLDEHTRDSDQRHAFYKEVQALARLNHPGIATIYDYGTVETTSGPGSSPPFADGTPWMAMEYVEGATLKTVVDDWSWNRLASRTLELLDALAHAHAREVLHRDLKPSNILIRSDDAPPIIADFGVAAVFEEAQRDGIPDAHEGTRGTPTYMAPEQILADWRRQGPWTDLYAVGCLIWRIVCASPPFDGDDRREILQAHLRHRVDDFSPVLAVPDGLEGWLRRLIAPRPDLRFRRAADAARALEDLGAAPDGSSREELDRPGATSDTLEKTSTATLSTVLTETLPHHPERPARRDREATPHVQFESPSVPEDWRRTHPDPSDSRSIAGLNLFGLRELPFVDREQECDAIWKFLRAVDRTDQPRVAVLVGPSGSGKSRLADWMATRAHELGAATPMWALHSPGGNRPNEGLAEMVRRLVRGHGLSRDAFYDHLVDHLPPLDSTRVDREVDARALTEFVHPTDDTEGAVEGPRYEFSSTGQKFSLLSRLLRRYGQNRPPFVWLDDIQWSDLAVPFVESLLDEATAPPAALCCLTVRAEELADPSGAPADLRPLLDDERCTAIELAPLESDDHRTFVERLLPLEETFAARIAEKTDQNPLFAEQLLGELIDQSKLQVSEHGFRPVDGVDLDLPDDLHELWHRRLRRLVEPFEPNADSAWSALETAAALGRELASKEWQFVCAHFDLLDGDRLVDEMVERGLAEYTERGWAFSDGRLVETLEHYSRGAGRWASRHRICARLLEKLHSGRRRRVVSRLADHWAEGDRPERAIESLLVQAETLRKAGRYEAAVETVERRGELLNEIGAPNDAPRRLANAVEHAMCQLHRGAWSEDPVDVLESVRDRAAQRGADALAAKALRTAGRYYGGKQEYIRARSYARRAAEAAERGDDDAERTAALHDWGYAEYLLGNLDGAEQKFTAAAGESNANPESYLEIEAHWGIGWVQLGRRNFERARRAFRRARRASRAAGYRSLEARCINGLGELARLTGEIEEARRLYRDHLGLARELNHRSDVAVTYSNLAQVELSAGRSHVAETMLEEAKRLRQEPSSGAQRLHVLTLIELAHAAGTEEWSTFDELWADYSDGWPDDARLFTDHPWLLELAGDLAASADKSHRARRAWRLARDLWSELDDQHATDRVTDKLAQSDASQVS